MTYDIRPRFLPAGKKLIQKFEGCRLKAYLCPSGKWTLGWGRAVGICEGMTCTQEQADQWLDEDIESFCQRVRKIVSPTLNDNQFTAAVVFAYNMRHWEDTPLFELLKAGKTRYAAERWRLYNKSNGKPSRGLVRRREAELVLFNTPVAQLEERFEIT